MNAPAPATSHPAANELRRFVLGLLDPVRQAEVESHVASCDACCDALRQVPDDTLLGTLKSQGADTRPVDTRPAPVVAASREESPTLPEELRDHPRFRILKQLGAGGMGVVYKAEHRFMERLVALKVINRRLIGNQTALERFRLEVKAAARLAHPNIVAAYDADQAGDLQMLVMEFVDGLSVARQVEKGGPLPVRHACQIARQVALGLQHAHEKGMVHRDIKPQNLMLTRDGRVKILDFGLARFARDRATADTEDSSAPTSAPGGETAGVAASLTRFGAALGTPDYMAPEQVRNARDVDIRADIYALGGTLYWMLAGHSPFPDGTVADKLESHLGREPLDLSFVRSDVPDELRRIVERMMAKNPAERFATPADVARALTPFCQAPDGPSGDSPLASPPSPLASPSHSLRGLVRTLSAGVQRHARGVTASGVGVLALLVLWFGLNALRASRSNRPESASSSVSADGVRRDPRGDTTDDGPRPRSTSDTRAAGSTQDRPRILLVVPQSGFSFVEFEMLRKACDYFGGAVEVGSASCEPARPAANTSRGGTVAVDVAIEDADPELYAAVVFLGATTLTSFDHLQDAGYGAQVRSFVQRLAVRNKPVAAIGSGTRVLADLDLLRGKNAARFAGQPADASYADRAHWQAQRVVIDGGFLTAADRSAVKELMQEVVTRFDESR